MLKFLIVGENSIDKISLINLLLKNENLFKVAKIFVTNESKLDDYHYLISNEELNRCYKNNAILYVKTILNESYGVTLDSFYENNLIFMNTEDFNNISNKIFLSNNELVIVWLDTKKHDQSRIKKEIKESQYILDKINSDQLNYLYFLDKDNIEIMDVICDYLLHEEKRFELLENYS